MIFFVLTWWIINEFEKDTWIHIESEEIDHPALLPSNVSWVLDPPPIWNFQFPQWWRFWIFSGIAHSSAHLRYKNFCMNRHFCFVWSVNEIYFSIKVFMKIFCLHIKSMNLKATSGWLKGPLNLCAKKYKPQKQFLNNKHLEGLQFPLISKL